MTDELNTEINEDLDTEEFAEEVNDSSMDSEGNKKELPEAKWYVIHTYSGYENKVKLTLEKKVENRGLEDYIQEIAIPTEEVLEIKDGKSKKVTRKVFPGYVLVKMVLNDENWYVVRNTNGVTGFVGPSSKPVPLTEEELAFIGLESDWEPEVDYDVGDSVKVINGPLESFIGRVDEINLEKKKVKVGISMFGRETPVELDLNQIMRV